MRRSTSSRILNSFARASAMPNAGRATTSLTADCAQVPQ